MASDESLPSVYRDDDLLVVDLRAPTFPDRCCKSYEAIDATRTRLELNLIIRDGEVFSSRDQRRQADEDCSDYPFQISPLPSEAAVLLSGIGGVIADTVAWRSHRSTLTFYLDLPLSPTWQARTPRVGLGGTLLLIGIALGVTSLMVLMGDMAEDDVWRFVGRIGAFFATVLAGVGAVMSLWQNREIVRARRYEDGFLWIAGTDSAFRSLFPEWPGSVHEARSAPAHPNYR